jgi:hypothetical protein
MGRITLSDFDATRLAQAVIIQAAKEAAKGDTQARRWLCEAETAETWFVLAGLSARHVVGWLQAGCHYPTRTEKTEKTPRRTQKTKETQAGEMRQTDIPPVARITRITRKTRKTRNPPRALKNNRKTIGCMK